MKEFNLLSALQNLHRNAIRLSLDAGDGILIGHFGGCPDVPAGFLWPTFQTKTFNDPTVKPRSLSFIAQFDCAALAPLDTENLLPHEGILSFFYELDSQTWGFSPEDAGSAKVYHFADRTTLSPAPYPADLNEDFQLPACPFYAHSETQYPDFSDFRLAYSDITHPGYWQEIEDGFDDFCDEYDRTVETLSGKDEKLHHQLLGWPVIIQNNMTFECELVSRGYYMGNTLKDIPQDAIQEADAHSLDDWILLFELDSDQFGDDPDDLKSCLDFGDCGSIYFYIRREELAARRFEKVWLISQCY